MSEGLLTEETFPTLNLDKLPSNVVITYSDGVNQYLTKDELLTRVKGYREFEPEKRRRTKNHNKNIGMAMSLRAIWQALVDEGDAKKAEAALVKAERNYDVGVLAGVYAEKLPGYGSAKQRERLKKFLAKHGFSLEG